MPLPAKIPTEAVKISSQVLTLIKRRRLLFNRTSSIVERLLVLTGSGHLLVYVSESQGYMVNLHEAVKVKSSLQRNTGHTVVAIQMEYGKVMMALKGVEGCLWVNAILQITEPTTPISKIAAQTNENPQEMELDSSVTTTTTDSHQMTEKKKPTRRVSHKADSAPAILMPSLNKRLFE